ncbi:MAG: blue light sensor protein, partial [Caulobacteraceae bacterium]
DSGYNPAKMSGEALFEALQRLALEDERSAA